MTELSPRARALFEAGRKSLQPDAADRERVFGALSARLDALEPEGSDKTSVPAGAKGLGWPALGVIVFGLAAAGTGVFQLLRPSAPPTIAPAPSSAPLASSSSDDPAPDRGDPAAAAPSGDSASAPTREPTPAGTRPSAPLQPSDSLAQEVAILSEAERALNTGQFQNALRLLDEHRRKFPHGTLAQERMAARVRALCGLGRVNEAEAALARLTRLSPNSPHQAFAREACATKN